jgi:hypothetical protein
MIACALRFAGFTQDLVKNDCRSTDFGLSAAQKVYPVIRVPASRQRPRFFSRFEMRGIALLFQFRPAAASIIR